MDRAGEPNIKSRHVFRLLLAVGMIAALAGSLQPVHAQSGSSVEIYAEGLINPKGMVFGDDGALYVAESGEPGDVMVPLPANFGGQGPIGRNGRISRIPEAGQREDFVTGLPNIGLYGGIEMLGAGSITQLDGTLYEVAAGHMTISPHLSRVSADGEMTPVADIGAFNDDNPPPPSNGDAVPMGNPYDVIALDGKIYVTDGNYNRIIESTVDGELSVLAQWENSPVTVGATAGPDGAIYVAQFGPAPYLPGTGRIDRVSTDGDIEESVVADLTTPIDAAFAPDGTMYVLQYAAEFSAEELRYIPFGGEVLRVNEDGSTTPVMTNLVFPTALTFGPDEALYVTNFGNESNDGQGQILRLVPADDAVRAPDVPAPEEGQPYAPPTATPGESAPVDAEVVLEIEIVEGATPDDWGYSPTDATVEVGQAVRFVNAGEIAHTATADDGSFDTGSLLAGESAVVVFDTPGDYGYFCQPHPWMRGLIMVVGEGQADTGSGASGTFENLEPPSVGAGTVVAFVIGLLVFVFGAGLLSRRRSHPDEPEPAVDETGD